MAKSDRSVVIAGFTEEDVRRLTGISLRQLGYWDVTGFFSPSLAGAGSRRSFGRLYSFRDLVCLQILNTLRNESRVPLPHLREVKETLAHLGDDMWAKTTLYVVKRRVVFLNPETQDLEEVTSGQKVLQIALRVVSADMMGSVKRLRQRDEATLGKVHRRKGVAHNRPVIAGTRVQVSSIKAFLEEGYSIERILAEYPTLTKSDVRAAMDYAAAA